MSEFTVFSILLFMSPSPSPFQAWQQPSPATLCACCLGRVGADAWGGCLVFALSPLPSHWKTLVLRHPLHNNCCILNFVGIAALYSPQLSAVYRLHQVVRISRVSCPAGVKFLLGSKPPLSSHLISTATSCTCTAPWAPALPIPLWCCLDLVENFLFKVFKRESSASETRERSSGLYCTHPHPPSHSHITGGK